MKCCTTSKSLIMKDFRKCPQNHLLKKNRQTDNIKYCSACYNSIEGSFMRCNLCGYKLCKSCCMKNL